VNFLGEDWIISEMEAPNTEKTNENELVAGGHVKLAKESLGGILNQGESLPVDNLKFQLDDLEAHGSVETAAIISVLNAADGSILKKDKIVQGTTKEFSINGKSYRVHVYKVAPGYTFGAKWADMAIYSHELELRDGQELDQDAGKNPGYQVSLGWKNLDASSAASTATTNPKRVDALRTIVVYSDSIGDVSSSGDEQLMVGDYVSLVQDPVSWKLSYKGLGLTSADKKSLKFEIKTSDLTLNKKFADKGTDSVKESCTIYAPYVRVSSGQSGAVFEADATEFTPGTTMSSNEFFVAVSNNVGGSGNQGVACDASPGWAGDNLNPGSVVMKLSSSSSDYDILEYVNPLQVKYSAIGDGSNAFSPPDGGAILIERANQVAYGDGYLGEVLNSLDGGNQDGDILSGANVPDFTFTIAEKAGEGTSNDFVDYYMFGIAKADVLATTPSDALFQFNADWTYNSGSDTLQVFSDNGKIFYGHATKNPATPGSECNSGSGTDYYCDDGYVSGPVNQRFELAEEGYVSERGSTFKSIDDRNVQFEMAHKLGKAQWLLAPSSVNASSADKTIVTLGEGESKTVNGVTVKVLEITEDVGACSAAGGAASCTANPVSAVIMPNNAASVPVALPYTGSYGNLVILDSDAVGVNTLVSVGGDKVNSVTADLLQGSAVDWTATSKVVKEVVQGSKIVVAGATKEDTLAAAADFVAQVKRT
jgi:hypothetical protein